MNSPTPTLALLKKEHSEVVTTAVLVKLLGSLITFFNVGKSMTDLQVIETCKLILQEYYFLKIEDLKLCFDGMKTGKYLPNGQLFDRLDGNIILQSLNKYTEERIQIAEIVSNEKHKAMADEYDAEEYLVKINGNYVMGTLDNGEEVEHKDMATKFDFREAIAIKNNLSGYYPNDKITIVYSNKSEIGLIDYLKAKRPDLVPVEEKEIPKQSYVAMKYGIMMDETLSELQKENKIRGLSGLASLSQDEFNHRKLM